MLFGTFILDFNTTGKKGIEFMYDFKTGQVKKVSIMDQELNYGIRGPREWDSGSGTAIAKNKSAEFVSAPAMLEAYQKKRLKGNGNEVAKNLLEDDNQVVRILTFKWGEFLISILALYMNKDYYKVFLKQKNEK